MAQYAIAFDLDTRAMRDDGMDQSQIVGVYQTEIPTALRACGFTVHAQGSLYHTEAGDQQPIHALMRLPGTLQSQAQLFLQYVRRVHIFRMEDWSDVTKLLTGRAAGEPPQADEELEEQESQSGGGEG
mgnify:CR=1 FL=1